MPMGQLRCNPLEVNSVRKPMKYLGTLLSTGTEEVLNADGTNRRMTTVRRTLRR
jgi:nitrate reductase beta subunit